MNRKRIIISAVLLSVIAVSVLLLSGKKSNNATPPAQAKPSLTVTTESPDLRVWPHKISATGSVQAWQEAVIGSEVTGLRLAELYVNVGETVKKGQLLARFSDEMASLDLDQQSAAAEEARARFVQAEAKAESSQKLKDAGMTSTLDNIQNQSTAQIAQAQLKAADARFKAQKLRLAYTQVRAPDDGIISSRSATVGSVMQTGNEMFRYLRRNQLEWRAEVPEGLLLQIRIGQKVSLRTSSGAGIPGKVSRISPVIDAQSRNGIVYVELTGTKNLKAGMFAQGDLELGHSNAMTVAQSAVVMRDGYSYLFMVGEDSRVAQTKVTTGRRQDERIEILQGLTVAMQIVTAGAGFLSDGDLVRVGKPDDNPNKNNSIKNSPKKNQDSRKDRG